MSKRARDDDPLHAANTIATQNPNKRVLLSYASDDESPIHVYDDGDRPLHRRPATDAAEGASGLKSTSSPHDRTETGRRQPLNGVSDDHDTEDKISRNPSAPATIKSLDPERMQRNDATGQRAALGSLTYQWEDDDEDEDYDSDEADAMSYLRAVRAERQNLPSVLKAPDTVSNDDIEEDGVGDTRGYWDDDAYVAAATLGPQLPDTHKARITPQEAFTTALKANFLKQRERLRVEQNHDKGTLTTIQSTFAAANPHSMARKIRKTILETMLSRSKLHAMSQSNVFKTLECVRAEYLRPQHDISSSTSAWIWSLLAKLDDVGSMDNDQVWQVRELGKQAILVQLSFVDPTAAEQLAGAAVEDDGAESTTVGDEMPVSQVQAEQAPSSSTLKENSAASSDTTRIRGMTRENTLATLDAIIVIVGEIFRQRDLLEFRTPWG